MAFTLPSGRAIEFKRERPTWGDVMDADEAGLAADAAGRRALFARAGLLIERLTGMTEEEIRNLDHEDGDALSGEVLRRLARRSDEEQAPFSNG